MLAVMVIDLYDFRKVGIGRKVRRQDAGMTAENIGVMSERPPDAVKLVIMQKEVNSLIEMFFFVRVKADEFLTVQLMKRLNEGDVVLSGGMLF